MGMMRFRVFPTKRITEEMVQQAYLSGIDRTPWPVRTSTEGGQVVLQRSVSDSANLHVPWPVEGHGQLTLASGSLMERPEPYWLPLELARGTIVQVRNQLCEWELIGLTVPAAVHTKLAEAVERFSRAAVEQEDVAVSAGYAEAGPAVGHRSRRSVGRRLCRSGAGHASPQRRQTNPRSRRRPRPDPLGSFHVAAVPDDLQRRPSADLLARRGNHRGTFSWTTSDKQIEWCRGHGLKVLAGPLLLLDPRAVPDWLYLFEDDFESVLDFVRR